MFARVCKVVAPFEIPQFEGCPEKRGERVHVRYCKLCRGRREETCSAGYPIYIVHVKRGSVIAGGCMKLAPVHLRSVRLGFIRRTHTISTHPGLIIFSHAFRLALTICFPSRFPSLFCLFWDSKTVANAVRPRVTIDLSNTPDATEEEPAGES